MEIPPKIKKCVAQTEPHTKNAAPLVATQSQSTTNSTTNRACIFTKKIHTISSENNLILCSKLILLQLKIIVNIIMARTTPNEMS